jgi:hypothetical protein
MRMKTRKWTPALLRALRTGSWASVASTAVLLVCGKGALNDSARPINGPSQWVQGRHAPHMPGASVKYTAVGYAIHHAMSVFWATLFERFRPPRPSASTAFVAASVTATAAFVADFHVVPKRLSPGFETELPRSCVIASYIAFAAALACAALTNRTDARTVSFARSNGP